MTRNQLIGVNIREFRQQMGLTQDALANYLKVKREMVSYYETGTREAPVEELMKLSDLFGCELSDLMEENEASFNACLAFAFRAGQLEDQDLTAIAEFKKVVKNYLNLIKLKFGTK